MEIKHLAWSGLALLVLASGWKVARSDTVAQWWSDRHHAPVKIEFDNGTVRQYGPPASAPEGSAVSKLPPGTLRKCRKGSETTYTNTLCPAGFTELTVGGTVNVVSGSAGTKPAAGAAPGAAASSARRSLRDALDVNGGPDLRGQAVDQAVDGGPRR